MNVASMAVAIEWLVLIVIYTVIEHFLSPHVTSIIVGFMCPFLADM